MSQLDDVLNAADCNMAEAWRAIIARSPHPSVTEHDGMVLLSSGVPVPMFNPTFIQVPPSDTGAAVDYVVAHYTERGLPFALNFRDGVAPLLADECVSRGLVEHWQPPLMVLDPIPVPTGTAPVDIVTLGSENLDTYLSVLADGFGMPFAVAQTMFGRAVIEIDGFTGFLGLLDGEPIGTSGLYLAEGVAGVYNVATLPAHRGKGIGAALTWAAAWAGGDRGATCSILQASKAGESVYRGMGFVTRARYRQFESGVPL